MPPPERASPAPCPEMAEQVQHVLRDEGGNMSEFLCDCFLLYMDEME